MSIICYKWTDHYYNPEKHTIMKNNYLIQKTIFLLLLIISTGWIFKAYPQNGWEQMEPISSARVAMGSCVIDNNIYLFGGYDFASSNYLAITEVYDTETGSSSPMANMSTGLAGPVAGVINGKIYLVGGFTPDDEPSNLVQEYDPVADSWIPKKELPLAMTHHTSCVLDNKLYILNPTWLNQSNWVYDPVTDEWDSFLHRNWPGESAGRSNCVYNNKIYVFGGHDWTNIGNKGYRYNNKAEMYDPETKVWTYHADMPHAIGAHINIVHDQKIYLFGGDTEGNWDNNYIKPSKLVLEYSPDSNSWQRMEDMPFKLSGMEGHKVGNYLYLIGGLNKNEMSSGQVAEVWKFNLDSLKVWVDPTTSINQHYQELNNVFSLQQNYPNPFSGNTTISYELKVASEVELFVYDMLGKKVVSLVNETQVPGKYDVVWNAEGVSAGVYFCELKVAGFRQINKMIVRP